LSKRILFAAAIIAGGIGVTAGGASATLVSPLTSPVVDNGNYVPAAYVVKKKVVRRNGRIVRTTTTTRYDPARHGQRFRHNSGSYVYYRDGYYYNRPWWTVGAPVVTRSGWVYSSRRHGQRYRYRHDGYRYGYGGYYYSQPWWTMGPGLSIQIN
jgi:hypothetical protein